MADQQTLAQETSLKLNTLWKWLISFTYHWESNLLVTKQEEKQWMAFIHTKKGAVDREVQCPEFKYQCRATSLENLRVYIIFLDELGMKIGIHLYHQFHKCSCDDKQYLLLIVWI